MKTITLLLLTITFCLGIDGRYTNYIKTCSSYYNIPYEILLAVITVESSWKENAVSYKGAVGLMQITTNCYKHYKKLNPKSTKKWISNFEVVRTDWKANVNVGSWYLSRVCRKEAGGDLRRMLSFYFWGPWSEKTTDKYYNKVMKKKKKLMSIAQNPTSHKTTTATNSDSG